MPTSIDKTLANRIGNDRASSTKIVKQLINYKATSFCYLPKLECILSNEVKNRSKLRL